MFRIKRLYLFILKTFLPLFFMTFAICLFIVLMQFLWRHIKDLVGKGIEIELLAELFFYAALSMVPLALPLAILLASLMTFGNLGERLELLSIKASGVSLIKMMRPLIITIVIISVAAFFFQNEAVDLPDEVDGQLRAEHDLARHGVRQQLPAAVCKDHPAQRFAAHGRHGQKSRPARVALFQISNRGLCILFPLHHQILHSGAQGHLNRHRVAVIHMEQIFRLHHVRGAFIEQTGKAHPPGEEAGHAVFIVKAPGKFWRTDLLPDIRSQRGQGYFHLRKPRCRRKLVLREL